MKTESHITLLFKMLRDSARVQTIVDFCQVVSRIKQQKYSINIITPKHIEKQILLKDFARN